MKIDIVAHPGHGRKTPVGTQAGALAAITDPNGAGFQYLGEGISRKVWLDPKRNVVYKVDLYSGRDWQQTNEFRTANELRAEGVRWAPPTSKYVINGDVVLAQPYYADSNNASQRVYDRLYRMADEEPYASILNDLHDGNWGVTKNGEPRVYDLGWT